VDAELQEDSVKLFDWLKADKQKPAPLEAFVKEFEARLPDQPVGVGHLDSRSSTWIYIHAWATEALQKAREKNDSANRDLVQTSLLRGEIKILKELINLPKPKPVRGLLEEEE
jgi:hypothetical protein